MADNGIIVKIKSDVQMDQQRDRSQQDYTKYQILIIFTCM